MEEKNAKKYVIPENFIDESRSLRGMVKTRNLIDGLILGGIIAILLLFIPMETRLQRVSVTIGCAGPIFVLSLAGVNGDPLSYFCKLALNWIQNRRVMLFNENTRAQSKSPLDAMLEKMTPKDQLAGKIDQWTEEKLKENREKEYVEGENFVFKKDRDLKFDFESKEKDDEIEKADEQEAEDLNLRLRILSSENPSLFASQKSLKVEEQLRFLNDDRKLFTEESTERNE